VIHASPALLIMGLLPGSSRFGAAAQSHAADLLAALHGCSAPSFGLAEDTLIGGLHQPNPWTTAWLDFFAEQRLRFMGQAALQEGRLSATTMDRLERLCARLDRWLDEPPCPALLHGDVWTTNVLALDERISGFLDPAVYYGHPEIELAFITLFGTFGAPFFARYQEHHPLDAGFFEARRDLYNLYPLLVHARLFGGGYVRSIERTLERFGC
jgi:fructosamine-3-kinase